jgi:hypothetical protein
MLDSTHDRGPGTSLVGYKRPPQHTRFKPGVSGNPSGGKKPRKKLKALFEQILNEEVSVRDGDGVKKITKAEALLRGVIVNSLQGDTRSIAMLLRLAEAAGEFRQEDHKTEPTVVILRRFSEEDPDAN